MTCKDKASYDTTPPCTGLATHMCVCAAALKDVHSAHPYESCQNIQGLAPPRCPFRAGTTVVQIISTRQICAWWKWRSQLCWVINAVPHDLVRRIRFLRIKSSEQDFEYLYCTMRKIILWNLITCKGTWMIDWVGRSHTYDGSKCTSLSAATHTHICKRRHSVFVKGLIAKSQCSKCVPCAFVRLFRRVASLRRCNVSCQWMCWRILLMVWPVWGGYD